MMSPNSTEPVAAYPEPVPTSQSAPFPSAPELTAARPKGDSLGDPHNLTGQFAVQETNRVTDLCDEIATNARTLETEYLGKMDRVRVDLGRTGCELVRMAKPKQYSMLCSRFEGIRIVRNKSCFACCGGAPDELVVADPSAVKFRSSGKNSAHLAYDVLLFHSQLGMKGQLSGGEMAALVEPDLKASLDLCVEQYRRLGRLRTQAPDVLHALAGEAEKREETMMMTGEQMKFGLNRADRQHDKMMGFAPQGASEQTTMMSSEQTMFGADKLTVVSKGGSEQNFEAYKEFARKKQAFGGCVHKIQQCIRATAAAEYEYVNIMSDKVTELARRVMCHQPKAQDGLGTCFTGIKPMGTTCDMSEAVFNGRKSNDVSFFLQTLEAAITDFQAQDPMSTTLGVRTADTSWQQAVGQFAQLRKDSMSDARVVFDRYQDLVEAVEELGAASIEYRRGQQHGDKEARRDLQRSTMVMAEAQNTALPATAQAAASSMAILKRNNEPVPDNV
eukprot:TRINITY_DN193_c4_g1_i1.p1 TRINITY_DN193_c4_g1~~TRINITY_DN193_c4_g1_i1.p1  ORF type:complete len:520 (+),score=163.76 TRINITY_DN193_c4_g1_i1:55-1560(+)